MNIFNFSLCCARTRWSDRPLRLCGEFFFFLFLVLPLCVNAAEPTKKTPDKKPTAPGAMQVSWEDLVPPDYKPEDVLLKYSKKLRRLQDGDPEAKQIMEEIRAAWNNAPVVAALNGKTIKMAGYVVPFEGDGKRVKEFLLVPYFGACIHTPPPPSNQIVYVVAPGKGVEIKGMFDIVWVTGTLRAETRASAVAQAGYTLNATQVVPY